MRRIAVFMLILVSTLALPFSVQAQSSEPASDLSLWQESAQRLNLQEMEQYKQHIDGELADYMKSKTTMEWLRNFVSGDWKLEPGEIAQNLWRYLLRQILANANLLGKILVLSVVSALLINIQASFVNQEVAKISSLACFMAIAAIALGSFKFVLDMGQTAIASMSGFMASILPQMMILVTGLGHINTAAAMFPLMITACTVLSKGIEWVVFPLIAISAVLNLTDCLTDTIKIERLGKLVYKLAEIVLGIMLTFFIGILTLKAIYGSVLDSFTLKTGKFVADALFPVVGGYLADILETAAGYVVLLKQGLGIIGVLIVFGIFVFPVIKIAIIAFIYKVSAALIEPIGDTRTSKALEVMGNHLLMVLAVVTVVGVAFMILAAIIAGIGNSVIFLR